jgi:hypothetical protein
MAMYARLTLLALFAAPYLSNLWASMGGGNGEEAGCSKGL